jgi:hypothetical protein
MQFYSDFYLQLTCDKPVSDVKWNVLYTAIGLLMGGDSTLLRAS